jgi:hypothetical protein
VPTINLAYEVRYGSTKVGAITFGAASAPTFTDPVYPYTIDAADSVPFDASVSFDPADGVDVEWYIERQAAVPTAVRAVAVSGTTPAGSVVSLTPGVYDGVETIALTYQWFADDAPISGATGTSYTLMDGDVGAVVSVVETATNGNGSTTTTAGIGPVTEASDPGEDLLSAFDVWLNGATDLVAGATATITPTNGSTITIGADTSATSTDPTITSTSITGDGVDDYLIFGDTPTIGASDEFTVVLAMRVPTKDTVLPRSFFTTNNSSSSAFGLSIFNEIGDTMRVQGRLRGVSANQQIFGNLLPSIYDGELWLVAAQVNSTTFKLQTYDGSTLTTQSAGRTSGDATQTVPPRLFSTVQPAAAEVFAAAYTQDTFSNDEITAIGDYLLALHGGD